MTKPKAKLAFTAAQNQTLAAIVNEAAKVAMRETRMSEADALLGLMMFVTLEAEQLVGSRPVARSLAMLIKAVMERPRDPVRNPQTPDTRH